MHRFVKAPHNLVGFYGLLHHSQVTRPQQKTLSRRQQRRKANLMASIRRGRDRLTLTDQQPNE